jgi:small subunit ribosomal protein S6e
MVFKINIGTKEGKTYKLEAEAPGLIDKKLRETVTGQEINPDLAGYEFEITGGSDKSGFTMMDDVQGALLNRKLLTFGKGMKKRPMYEGKKKRSNNRPKGLRLRKTVRGNTISDAIVQVNLKMTKEGGKKLSEVFAAPVEEKKEE